MSWSNNQLTTTFTAEGAIEPYRIVKQGAANYGVLVAGASSDLLVGVTTDVDATSGERCDVVVAGIAEIKLGSGGITRGQPITAATGGLGVHANPSAGQTAQVIGYALISGSEGDVIPVVLARSQRTTPAM